MKLNNKGFLLTETLIATCIIAILSTTIYVYISKTIDNYTKRDSYDNVVDVYKINNLKISIENDTNITNVADDLCNKLDENPEIWNTINLKEAYICKGNGFKENLINTITDNEYKEYVRLLSLKDLNNDLILIGRFENSQGRKESFASIKVKVGG